MGLRVLEPGEMLQWGRDLEIAEIEQDRLPGVRVVRFNGAAIWRSRKWRSVRRATVSRPGFNGAAIWRSRKFPLHGHAPDGLYIASMGPRSGDRGNYLGPVQWSGFTALQWGRDLEIAEINGQIDGASGTSSLQWGRDLEIAEIACPVLAAFMRNWLQWGRDLEIAEMMIPPGGGTMRTCFNGAAIWRSRKWS